jgi:hypothetical protein
MKTIKQFCSEHRACSDGQKWALAHCKDMQEVWEKAPNPSWVIWIATRRGVLTDRELRLFAVWCARQVQHLLTDPRSINAIDVAERYANGEATDRELTAARSAAWAAAWGGFWTAPGAAAIAAARTADGAAAWDAAWAAARAADSAATSAAALAAQAERLRNNTQPNFS